MEIALDHVDDDGGAAKGPRGGILRLRNKKLALYGSAFIFIVVWAVQLKLSTA